MVETLLKYFHQFYSLLLKKNSYTPYYVSFESNKNVNCVKVKIFFHVINSVIRYKSDNNS